MTVQILNDGRRDLLSARIRRLDNGLEERVAGVPFSLAADWICDCICELGIVLSYMESLQEQATGGT